MDESFLFWRRWDPGAQIGCLMLILLIFGPFVYMGIANLLDDDPEPYVPRHVIEQSGSADTPCSELSGEAQADCIDSLIGKVDYLDQQYQENRERGG